jgi:tetratricopeptide (TPR) repeat protein
MSFGGPPTFEPSAWEWSFRAAALRADGDAAEARKVLDEGIAEHPSSPGILYELACWEASEGDADAAIGHLREVRDIEPERLEHAREDSDLESLRDREDFRDLLSS